MIDNVVVFPLDSLVEPHLSFLKWAGKSHARQDLVEFPSSFVLQDGTKSVAKKWK